MTRPRKRFTALPSPLLFRDGPGSLSGIVPSPPPSLPAPGGRSAQAKDQDRVGRADGCQHAKPGGYGRCGGLDRRLACEWQQPRQGRHHHPRDPALDRRPQPPLRAACSGPIRIDRNPPIDHPRSHQVDHDHCKEMSRRWMVRAGVQHGQPAEEEEQGDGEGALFLVQSSPHKLLGDHDGRTAWTTPSPGSCCHRAGQSPAAGFPPCSLCPAAQLGPGRTASCPARRRS